MSRFAQKDPHTVAQRQAVNVMKQVQGNIIKSVGTVRNYEQALKQAALYANKHLECGLKNITSKQAEQYLNYRAVEVGQKTLDMDRQALQCMMRHVSKVIDQNDTLTIVKSEHQQVLSSRAYTQAQIDFIIRCQNERNGLATEIAHAAGLRAHELLTLRRIDESTPDLRPALEEKFSGRDGERYTVKGKGGLIREIQIPTHLSARLEARRLTVPSQLKDRGVYHLSYYDIGGGKAWSNSFSAASGRVFGWSGGAHGLRHSYAQERLSELQKNMVYQQALEVVSQEMGHFRPEITEIYLR